MQPYYPVWHHLIHNRWVIHQTCIFRLENLEHDTENQTDLTAKEFKVVKQRRTTAADRRRLHIFTAFSDTKPSHCLSQQWSHTMRGLSDPMQLLTSSHRLLMVNLDVSTDAHAPTRSSEAAIQEAAKRYRLQFH